jgi:CubicO group peptidase (beta-lactamase class C family)
MGFALNSPEVRVSPNPRTCWWGGWGGSHVRIDYDARTTLTYVMNRMEAGLLIDARAASLARAFYGSLNTTGEGEKP